MTAVRWFRLGDAVLGLESDDRALSERFEEIYGECAVERPDGLATIRCRVETSGDRVRITFDDPEPLDVARFAEAVFPGRTFPADASADGRTITAPPDSEWRAFVANLAVSRLQRLQQQVVFFHAATLAMRGRGVMACGPKRSGKTTLALALASRGHDLLGDELAAVRLPTRELLPVRRSLAVREGPASARASASLAALRPDTEVFPDGEVRSRVAVARLFPPPAAPAVALTDVLLLRTFAAAPAATAAPVTPALLGQLTPLAASLWNRPPGAVTVRLLRLLASCRIWWIDAGPPDDTARMIEQLMEMS